MSVESTFYSGTWRYATGTYNGGTQIRLNGYDSETMVHETGHAISNYLNANFACSDEFKNAFNVGLQRYLADGHRQNIDIWSEDDYVNVSYGAYCTTDPMECFAECYTLLMLGMTEDSTSALVKYFPECLELVKEFLKQVRNMDDSVRKS